MKLKQYNFDSRRTYCIGCAGGWICFGKGSGVLNELKDAKLGGCRLGKSDPKPFTDREIKDVYERADGTIAIIIDGPEVGKFWTLDEYMEFKGEPVERSETKFTDREAVAIMIQTAKAAAKDYRDAREALMKCRGEKSCTTRCACRRKRPKNCRDTIKEVKEFFSGALFGAAFPGVDADYMLAKLEEDELEKSESVSV